MPSHAEIPTNPEPQQHLEKANEFFEEALLLYNPENPESPSVELIEVALLLGKGDTAQRIVGKEGYGLRVLETAIAQGHLDFAKRQIEAAVAKLPEVCPVDETTQPVYLDTRCGTPRHNRIQDYRLLVRAGDPDALARCYEIAGFGTPMFNQDAGVALAGAVADTGDYDKAWEIADKAWVSGRPNRDRAFESIASAAARNGAYEIATETMRGIEDPEIRAQATIAIASETRSEEDFQAARDDIDAVFPAKPKSFWDKLNKPPDEADSYTNKRIDLLCALYWAGDGLALEVALDEANSLKHRSHRHARLISIYEKASGERANELLDRVRDSAPKSLRRKAAAVPILRKAQDTLTLFSSSDFLESRTVRAAAAKGETMVAWNLVDEQGFVDDMKLEKLIEIAEAGHPHALDAALIRAETVIADEEQTAKENTRQYGWEKRFNFGVQLDIQSLARVVARDRGYDEARKLVQRLPGKAAEVRLLAECARMEIEKQVTKKGVPDLH